MIDHSGLKVKSVPKNTLREWDRYNSEVYVYGLGAQPQELNKKYKVGLGCYELNPPKPREYEMTEYTKRRILECRDKVFDSPITSIDLKQQRNLFKYANSVLDNKAITGHRERVSRNGTATKNTSNRSSKRVVSEVKAIQDMEVIRNRMNRTTLNYM